MEVLRVSTALGPFSFVSWPWHSKVKVVQVALKCAHRGYLTERWGGAVVAWGVMSSPPHPSIHHKPTPYTLHTRTHARHTHACKSQLNDLGTPVNPLTGHTSRPGPPLCLLTLPSSARCPSHSCRKDGVRWRADTRQGSGGWRSSRAGADAHQTGNTKARVK